MDKKRYSHTFLLSLKNKYTEPPVGFHPVYIKQKRVQCSSKSGSTGGSSSGGSTSGPRTKGKWDNLEKIRAFASSDNSFIQRTRNRSTSEVLLGELRSLLNKVTDKTFEAIIEKLGEIDYEQFDDEMIDQSVKVYLSKAISDKDYGDLYCQIGSMLHTQFKSFKDLLTQECVGMCIKLFEGNSDIQKAKCLGLMKVLSQFQKEGIVDAHETQTKILDVVCQRIDERKHSSESYAQIAATGGCGLYIELLCKYCENLGDDNDQIERYTMLLTELKGIKTIPARVRFMVEDTLILLKK